MRWLKTTVRRIKDAIGDVAVCLVNYANMTNDMLEQPVFDPFNEISVVRLIGEISHAIGIILMGETQGDFETMYMLCVLIGIAQRSDNVVFTDCCAQAWHEIKDRKGRMVQGGAFVKED